MTNKIEKKLAKTPVAERRGVWTTFGADTWEEVLIKTDFESLMSSLESGEGIGGVDRDVTSEVLTGKFSAPEGAWFLVIEMVGAPWLHIAHGYRYFSDYFEQIVKLVKAPVIRVGFQDTAHATYVFVDEGERKILHFESTGMQSGSDPDDEEFEEEFEEDFEVPLRFETELLPKDWPEQFKSEDLVQQALMRELDAYAPMIGTGTDESGNISLWAGHEDVLDQKYIKRIGLVLVGQKRSPRKKKNPADKKLSEAIREMDVDRVREAISQGASLSLMPGTTLSPLGMAVDSNARKDKECIEVVRVLLDAGADPNDGGAGGDPPLATAVSNATYSPKLAAVLCELLLNAGASPAAHCRSLLLKGQTAVHVAAIQGNLAMIQMLHARGVDLMMLDTKGRTARQAAEDSIRTMIEYMGEDAEEHIGGHRSVVDYLVAAENGAPPNADWQAEIDRRQRAATRTQREMKVKFGELGKAFKQLGELMNEEQAMPDEDAGETDEAPTVQDMVDLLGPDATRQALGSRAKGIRLTPDDSAWDEEEIRDQYADEFEQMGFEKVGYFIAPGIVQTRILAFVNQAENWYGVIYEPDGQGTLFCDVVRLHQDGSVLTATNTAARAPYQLERFRKIRKPGVRVRTLVKAMRAEPVPACGLMPVSASAFVESVRRVTADEQDELMRSLE